MHLFGFVRHGRFIGRVYNFSSIGSALLLLFRVLTGTLSHRRNHSLLETCFLTRNACCYYAVVLCCAGEDWNSLLYDCSVDAPLCTMLANGVTDCGSYWHARLYFYSYIALAAYLLQSLLIAVLVENFSPVFMKDSSAVGAVDLDRCVCVFVESSCD